MEGGSTKERALHAALELFGSKGYDGVSMNDIAQAVGIRAPSLYKHFPSKEALFAAVSPAAAEHYQAMWAEVAAGQSRLERDARTLGNLSAERLEQDTLAWVRVQLEQGKGYRAFLAQSGEDLRWLWDEPLGLYTGLFTRLIEAQVVKRCDPHVLAVEYLAPIFQFLRLADRDEGLQGSVIEETRRHVRQFHRAFAVRERPIGSVGGGVRGFFRR